MIDYDHLIETLCRGMTFNRGLDIDHLHDMVYGDIWLQDHHEPYSDKQRKRILFILETLYVNVVEALSTFYKYDELTQLNICYSVKHTTRMSVSFEIR